MNPTSVIIGPIRCSGRCHHPISPAPMKLQPSVSASTMNGVVVPSVVELVSTSASAPSPSAKPATASATRARRRPVMGQTQYQRGAGVHPPDYGLPVTHERLVVGALLANVPGAIYRSNCGRNYAIELITDEIERISGYSVASFREGGLHDLGHHPPRRRRGRDARGGRRGARGPLVRDRVPQSSARPGRTAGCSTAASSCTAPAARPRSDGVLFDITDRRAQEAVRRAQEADAARTDELRASRARIVAAADAARRRIERDLHDGAQQELVTVALGMRIARNALETDPAQAAVVLDGAMEQLAHALAELRELARGIHPAVLTERGSCRRSRR